MVDKSKKKLPTRSRNIPYIIDRAEAARQSNQRNKAISESYFNRVPTIGNLAKGVYYYLKSDPHLLGELESNILTGTAPMVGVAKIPGIAKSLLESDKLLRGIAASGLIGEQFLNHVLRRNPTYPSAKSLFDVQPQIETSVETSAETGSIASPSSPNNDNDDKLKKDEKKDEKKNSFRTGAEKVGRNILNMYGKMLTGGAYATGVALPTAGIYGTYQWLKPDPTAADSLLNEQSRLILELNKLNTARLNLATIDSLRRLLSNPNQVNSGSGASDTVVVTPVSPTSSPIRTRSADEIMDSLNRVR